MEEERTAGIASQSQPRRPASIIFLFSRVIFLSQTAIDGAIFHYEIYFRRGGNIGERIAGMAIMSAEFPRGEAYQDPAVEASRQRRRWRPSRLG